MTVLSKQAALLSAFLLATPAAAEIQEIVNTTAPEFDRESYHVNTSCAGNVIADFIGNAMPDFTFEEAVLVTKRRGSSIIVILDNHADTAPVGSIHANFNENNSAQINYGGLPPFMSVETFNDDNSANTRKILALDDALRGCLVEAAP